MSTIRFPKHILSLKLLAWHQLKCGGKRYSRWLKIRPDPDPIGDNYEVYRRRKTYAKRNNRDIRRQCGCEAA